MVPQSTNEKPSVFPRSDRNSLLGRRQIGSRRPAHAEIAQQQIGFAITPVVDRRDLRADARPWSSGVTDRPTRSSYCPIAAVWERSGVAAPSQIEALARLAGVAIKMNGAALAAGQNVPASVAIPVRYGRSRVACLACGLLAGQFQIFAGGLNHDFGCQRTSAFRECLRSNGRTSCRRIRRSASRACRRRSNRPSPANCRTIRPSAFDRDGAGSALPLLCDERLAFGKTTTALAAKQIAFTSIRSRWYEPLMKSSFPS